MSWLKGEVTGKKAKEEVRLADYIHHLRRELSKAAREGEGEKLRFGIEEIEVELEVATSEESSAEGGWDQWVVLKVGGTDNKTMTQKMRLKLKPLQGKELEEAKRSGNTLLSGER